MRAASSISAVISFTSVRSSCWRVRMVTSGFFHAASISSAMPAKSGLGYAASATVVVSNLAS